MTIPPVKNVWNKEKQMMDLPDDAKPVAEYRNHAEWAPLFPSEVADEQYKQYGQ